MLNFSEAEKPAIAISQYYCQKLKSPKAEDFFSGKISLSTKAEALEIAKVFWDITELASADHLNDVVILDDVDIEFWMYKLFNKTHGYFQKNGFSEEWKQAETDHS